MSGDEELVRHDAIEIRKYGDPVTHIVIDLHDGYNRSITLDLSNIDPPGAPTDSSILRMVADLLEMADGDIEMMITAASMAARWPGPLSPN